MKHRFRNWLLPLLLLGGGVGQAAVSETEAVRFLGQATFGPTVEDISHLSRIGYQDWLNEQFDQRPGYHLPAVRLSATDETDTNRRMEVWWEKSVWGRDQLRQRMAFALSQIFVVSEYNSMLAQQAYGTAYFYDILLRNAFGNFRTLLEDVTLSPAMGVYLNMLGNGKPEPENGIRADENFARESMQLFTIGLDELNLDGTPRLDGAGNAIPTYSQKDIENLARVFTGWTSAGTSNWNRPAQTPTRQMVPFESYHDTDAKTIIGGVQLPAGQTARQDLELALDTLFNHPNVGPFIGKQLIQRLVTSNPSPAYVARVASVFNDNGQGVRGDLKAVVSAILLDPEARSGYLSDPQFGKLREPVLRVSHLWRAFRASSSDRRIHFGYPDRLFGEGALRSPSVFNFYRPDYTPPGELAEAGLTGPEFQIATDPWVINLSNFLFHSIHGSFRGADWIEPGQTVVNLNREARLASNPQALIDHLDLLLMAGQMPVDMRNSLLAHTESLPLEVDSLRKGMLRALDAVFLIMISPQYAIQR